MMFFWGVVLGFLHGNGAAVHQLLHIGVVVGELGKPAVPVQVRPRVACMTQEHLAAAHQCAHSRGAHARQRFLTQGLLEHKAVGAEQALFQKGLLFAGQALGSILLLKAALDHIARALAGFPAAACTAHAVAYQQPCGIAGQFSCAIIVLIILPDPADIRFSCKFHRLLPLIFTLSRSFRHGAAGRMRR